MAALNEEGVKPFFFAIGMPLQIEIGGVSIKMRSISVGMLIDQFLIIKYPDTGTFGSIQSRIFKGNKITVRYIAGGDVFGFELELIEMITSPIRLLFISYPTFVAKQSLRSNRRIECSIPARLKGHRTDDDGIFDDGIITDISTGGCRFTLLKESPEQKLPEINTGGNIVLHMELPGVEE
jgi:hypothetical protein